MSNKKIWSIPIAIVALLMLAAIVFAAAPKVGMQIPDQELTISATNGSVEVDLTNVDGGADNSAIDNAFTDEDTGDTLAYTALTADAKVAKVTNLGDGDGVANAWWNSVGDRADDPATTPNETLDNASCAAKAERLGFSLTANTVTTDVPDRADNAPADATTTTAQGFCLDTDDGDLPENLHEVDTSVSPTIPAVSTTSAIVTAFHWDMLTVAEMGKAATAAGVSNPSSYAVAYASLSHAQKVTVASWFTNAGGNILTRGTSNTFTLQSPGINNDEFVDGADGPGKVGETTIYVKASDDTGRFLANSIGQSFKVKANPTATGAISAFTAPDDTPSDQTTVSVLNGSAVSYVGPSGQGTNATPARYDVSINVDSGNIAQVNVNTQENLAPHHQKVSFILRARDGSANPFQITKTGRQVAQIAVKSNQTVTAGQSFKLTLQVNELGNVAANYKSIPVNVTVIAGSSAPMLDTDALDAHFEANPITVREHKGSTEAKDVYTRGLKLKDDDDEEYDLNFSAFASDADGQGLTYSLIPDNSYLEIDSSTGVVSLVDPTPRDKDYDKDEATDEFTLTVSDGAQTATYEFDVAIKTNKPVADEDDSRVTYTRDDDDEVTAITAVVTKGTPENGVREDDTNIEVVDIVGLLLPVDVASELEYTDNSDDFKVEGGKLILDNVRDAADTNYVVSKTVVITADDGYATSDNPNKKDSDGNDITDEHELDLTMTVNVTVHVAEPPTIGSKQVEKSLAENTTGVIATTANLYTVPSGAQVTPYYHYVSGTGNATIDETTGLSQFTVDTATGEVTVATAQDYEDSDGPDGAAVNKHTLSIFVKDGGPREPLLSVINITINETDVNEAPSFGAAPPLTISEKAQNDTNVGDPIAASDVDAGDTLSYSIKEGSAVPFSVMKTDTGAQIQVAGDLDIDSSPYSVTLVATDSGGLTAELALSITVGDENDAPSFDAGYMTEFKVNEQDSAAAQDLATYNATDVDDTDALQGVKFVLTDSDDARHFVMTNQTNDTTGEHEGVLSVKAGANLDVDAAGTKSEYELLLAVCDKLNACSEKIDITVTITPMNDNTPVFNAGALRAQSVPENTARETVLGDYSATDADGDAITYSLSGADSKSFSISDAGMLMTLEALDADNAMTPCGVGCEIKVTASDGEKSVEMPVKIIVTNVDDSVSSFSVSKANPIANISSDGDDAMSALADGKTTMSNDVPESPADLPAMMHGSEPRNFVTADWANWYTVLRIEVTAESPVATCGNGNQCVFVDLESKDSGHELTLIAYRSSEKDNEFVAAVQVVKKGEGTVADGAVYKHNGSGVARLEAEEEDEIEIRLAGSKIAPITVEVENEAPEFDNFMPAHEAAYDEGDVDYTFTITDAVSGIPEPEDLPDTNGNSDYMPLVALVSGSQCHTVDPNDKKYSVHKFAGNSVWCMSKPEIRAVTDDRDFDEIDDGFEVETTIVLDDDMNHWVTFVACDAAGNCELYTPDENKTDEALPLITIDTQNPVLADARTGIKWDETDEELDMDNPTWIQVIFTDLSPLDDGTVEADDFVVQGHTVKAAKRYEDDADEGNKRMVFLELEDELAPDEEPEVTLVPNGVADIAGNDQDEGEVDAKDYISPSFAVVSMVSPGTPDGSSNVLAGDGDEVVIRITSDERIRKTQPDVSITYVNAPAGCVETSVDRSKLTAKGDDSTYARGEIILAGHREGCDDNSATGHTLGKTFEKVSNTEWTVTVKEPEGTGYYNIYIEAADRSAQNNMGSEGVAPDDIDTDFFERDGDVNSGDAHYFQGDINLPYPGVWVSGQRIEETEPAVEFKTPLFVELDFTSKYIKDCAPSTDGDEYKANCLAESDEYAKDSFDSVKVTSFVLDGTDITDSVKTTDDETFLVSIDGISIGDHEIEVQALDQAGNDFAKTLSIEFEVEERDAFSHRLSPGWNLVSLPGEPADSSISVVFGSDVEVRTVYTYDPIMPGGWMVAVRETVDSDWQGDLMEITARRGYWVLSDAIQDWEVSIPRLAGGAVGSGTPIQPPVIALYAGWNLVPVIDVTGDFAGDGISAQTYLQSLDDGLDLARVLGFDTITNSWSTIKAPESGQSGTLEYGKAYWVFVRQAASLVPGN